MAWTDVCRVQFAADMEKLISHQGMGVRRALEFQADEQNIPYETLKRWFYEGRKPPVVKTDNKPPPTQAQVYANVLKRLQSLAKYMENNIDPTDETYEPSEKQKKAFRDVLGRLDLNMNNEFDESSENCSNGLKLTKWTALLPANKK
jgi:hypothetical protein